MTASATPLSADSALDEQQSPFALRAATATPSALERLPASGAWDDARAALGALTEFEDGWDGEDALAVDPRLRAAAERFAGELERAGAPAPRVLPTRDGGVQLEWLLGSRRLELEFDRDSEVVFVCDDPHLPVGIDGVWPRDEAKLTAAIKRTLFR